MSLIANASKAKRKIFKLAITDKLTDVYNRRSFQNIIRAEFLKAKTRPKVGLSLIMLDIDHFKRINDTYGHTAGDFILQSVAGIVEECLRDGVDVLARYGGEEFAVIMPRTDLPTARVVAERIRKAVAERIINLDNKKDVSLTVSLGVVSVNKETRDSEYLIRLADKCLYSAKGMGRNRVVWWDPQGSCVNPLDTDESGKSKVSSSPILETFSAVWALISKKC